MILAIDAHYHDTAATVAGVAFSRWDAAEPDTVYTARVTDVPPYVAGQFYQRELPCILQLLSDHELQPDIIIIDGYVYLNGMDQPGLGKHLYDALNQAVCVIGVAKQAFKGINDRFAVYRGSSKHPLYVTAAGVDTVTAQKLIQQMHGAYRNPSLLKKVDAVCRGK